MASRSLEDLAAPVKSAAMAMLARCRAAGLEVLIYCTLRSNDEQAALYAQGRTRPGGQGSKQGRKQGGQHVRGLLGKDGRKKGTEKRKRHCRFGVN